METEVGNFAAISILLRQVRAWYPDFAASSYTITSLDQEEEGEKVNHIVKPVAFHSRLLLAALP
ncbi:MAG: hypothetical protein ETSY1_15420 [Candidatus Entotheonella factor]|uniref:Uncharacterized protein n=1 Tax=Entotheonella factor TaxID=1429438 RepID=W4LN63_ENTF1|nr:MAG: hypothetical protein ETSY1_15420 [Candidatus Entotheonella factor]